MVRLLQVMLRFYHHESCGQCTPCREGMGWMHRIIDRIVAGEGRPDDIDRLIAISEAQRRHDDLRHGRRRRLRDRRHPRQVPRRVRVLDRARRSRHDGTLEGRTSAMPEIFINGQRVEAERRPDGDAGGAARAASTSRTSAGTRRCRSPATAGSAWSRSKATTQLVLDIACNMPVAEGHARADRLATRARAPQGDAAARHAQPPGRLRHLRQGRRVHAAGLPLRVQRRAVGLARRQGHARPSSIDALASASCSTTSAASCARAACASRARSRSRTRSASRSAATTSLVRAAEDGAFDARSLLRQRHRHLPGRRAAVAAVPVQGARLVPRSRRRRSAPAARAAARSTSGTARREWKLNALDPTQNAQHRRASRRSRTRRSTDRGSATRDATWRGSSSGRAPTQAMLQGQAGRARDGASSGARALIATRAAAGRAGVELGLQRGARCLRARARRALRRARQARPRCPRPASGSRTTSSSAPTRTRTRAGARARCPALPADRDARLRRPTATSSSSGAKASTSRSCRAARRSIFLDAYVAARERRTPTCSSRSASRPSAAATTRTSRASSARSSACFAEAAGGRRRRGAVRRARRTTPGERAVIQDLVVAARLHRLRDGRAADVRHGPDVGRAQAGGGDVRPHRRQPRLRAHPVHADQARLVGPVPRPRRRPQDAAQGRLQAAHLRPRSPTRSRPGSCSRRCCWCSPSIPFGGTLDPGAAARHSRRVADWFGDRTYPMQIARLDAGLLVVFAFGGLTIIGAMLAGWSSSNKFSLLGGAARRLADDLLRARHGPHRARA